MYNICPNSMGVGPPLVPRLWEKILVVTHLEKRRLRGVAARAMSV
jgi:hypothetical protein